jgi:hypothetical protein
VAESSVPGSRGRRPQSRAEAARARKELRGWRRNKLGWIAVGVPIVLVAAVGVAMAAPHHQASGAACSAAGLPMAPAAYEKNNNQSASASSTAAAQTTTTAAGAGGTSAVPSTSGAPAAPAASTAAAATSAAASTAAAAASTTSAAAATTTTATTAATTSSAAACATSSAAAAAATPNPNCTLIVPANPLSAKGLATPYQLVATDAAMGPCNEANTAQSAFVEAAILTPRGQITLYDPLVIDKGTQPAATPTPANVANGSAVGIWFGFNGTNLTLQSAAGTNSLRQGACVNGLNGSIFGQFAYCGAPNFFNTANREIAARMLRIPAVGTAKDGLRCPTTRDFSVVDQDQSDNVVTHYLAGANGQIAQNNAAGTAALPNGTDLANGSDNLLLTKFVDPALGCTPLTAPDQSSGNTPSGALPLDELSAAANQRTPIAIVPLTDPMTLNNNNASNTKTNLYRAGVDQTPVNAADRGSGATYCRNLFGSASGIARVFKDMAIFQNAPSVDAAMATNLFTFLAMRANQSFTNLNCQGLLNVPNPIALTTDGNGVVTAAVMVPLGQTPPTAPAAAGAATPTAKATKGHKPMKKVRW